MNNATDTQCPAWCFEDQEGVFELGDRVHLGEPISVRATLHDDDDQNTIDEGGMAVSLNQRPGHPVYVIVSDANGRGESRLLLEEAEQLVRVLLQQIAAARGVDLAELERLGDILKIASAAYDIGRKTIEQQLAEITEGQRGLAELLARQSKVMRKLAGIEE